MQNHQEEETLLNKNKSNTPKWFIDWDWKKLYTRWRYSLHVAARQGDVELAGFATDAAFTCLQKNQLKTNVFKIVVLQAC